MYFIHCCFNIQIQIKRDEDLRFEQRYLGVRLVNFHVKGILQRETMM